VLTSALWVGGEIFLGVSLVMFVGALIATFGDQLKMGTHGQSAHTAAPQSFPNTAAFRFPALDRPQLGHFQIVGRARLVPSGGTFATRLGDQAQRDHVNQKGLARNVTSREAA
jgi:hypothetical protein